MIHISRRRLLQTGATTIAATGVAGCLGQGGGSLDSVTVAYVPIYPNMQHYVMEQEGYYEDVPTDVTIERFSSGPSVVKAFASGNVDVALFGITPAMVLVDKGTNAGILAANSRSGFKIMGTTELVDLYEQEGPAVFERFEEERGRKVRFGAPPDGSVPDIVLRYWIQEDIDVGEMESAINKSKVPPAKAVQTIQSGDIDATIIQEPFATVIGQADGFGELAWSGNILDNHPVTVLFANQRVLDDDEVAQSLVEQHVAATEFTGNSPDAAASHAASVIGSGVSEDLATAAVDSKASEFISDPHAITDQAATMGEFVANVGNIEESVATEDLFAFDPYDAIQ
ncbi:nitrate ABC transporter substrate-binding protein [Halorubrum ezzemoulense]|uniref:Nitrate ABC transporter substrate-binding protein n=1 Tax=Halorubrum ezzemoulense TaxID=337243 RepID=A0A256IVF6_HALEZ|nr:MULTISPECIES: ABC transporter substrate-binding protein [Halorubrum]OYR60443.1 nitrate ABC transporter substrate-binding protein [Halorubrum ezzemoulense]OYR76642.1 nitrate ABC transporter substrate-binding protein [Halorubrum ezzemoulense]OYR84850.1 nitrate ABC transporter substrate-binding protein [Halorubrum ezzemoulense]PHQ41129.1 nitrate ABC transporter substrate-binding protein [Halorubrum sp. C191]QAY21768.1 nitrate ABC transporter substrate-binding protein [Halorubrum ezzemoulense]